jgi:Tol biopolymer transport system component
MRLRRLARPASFLIVLALGGLGGSDAATPSRGASAGAIVFLSNRDTHQPGEIYSLARGRPPLNITHNRSTDIGLAISPVGDTIAFWSNRLGRFHVYLARADGSHLRTVKDLVTPSPDALVFSRDGRRLFADVPDPGGPPWPPRPISAAPGTYVIDVAHPTARQVLPALRCLRLSPSPDGRLIACFTDYRLETVYDLAGHTRFAFASDQQPSWSSLGMLVSSSGSSTQDQSNSIVDESGATVARFRGTFCGWSPDGRLLEFERGGVVRIGSPRHLSRARRLPGATTCVALVGDGRYFETYPGPLRLRPVSGGTPIRWPAPQTDPSTFVWSRDNRLAFVTGAGSELPGASFAVQIRDLHGHGGVVGRFPVSAAGANDLQWLPDGRGVLLDASWDTGSKLYSVPATGGATRPFGRDPQAAGPAAWSRDGHRITYIGALPCFDSRSGCAGNIMTASEDGSDPQVVLEEFTGDKDPSFSPDGRKIVFLQGVTSVFQIAIVPVSGGAPTVLAPSITSDAPAWSPDGSTIADIVLDSIANTLSLRRIEPTSGQTSTIPTGIPYEENAAISLAWSPDGTHIAISGAGGISVLPVSSGGPAELAIAIPGAAHPSYSPDGTQVAFDAPLPSTGQQTAIMVANSDGTDARVLSTVPLTDSGFPAWQPNP